MSPFLSRCGVPGILWWTNYSRRTIAARPRMDRRVTRTCWISFVSVLALCGAALAQPVAPTQPRTIDALPSVMPIFPLADATLFPQAANLFHIFEPRYRAMVADALTGDRVIGMVTLKPGFEANYDGRPAIHAIGCAGVIEDFEELPDGRFKSCCAVSRGFASSARIRAGRTGSRASRRLPTSWTTARRMPFTHSGTGSSNC